MRGLHLSLSVVLGLMFVSARSQNPKLPVPTSTPPESTPIYSYDYSNDPCGDPRKESGGWAVINGRVVKVFNGESVLLAVKGRQIRVQLASVAAPPLDQTLGREAKAFLENQVGRKIVALLVDPHDWILKGVRPRKISGILSLRGSNEHLNMALLKAGLANYEEPKPYLLGSYTKCTYQNAEKEAQASKRGVWRRPA